MSLQIQGRINREISTEEYNNIQALAKKEGTSADQLNSIWGKIADIFCGTKKEAAKEHLFNVLKAANSMGYVNGEEKCKECLKEFNALKALAPDSLQKMFPVDPQVGGDTKLTIPGEPPKKITLSKFTPENLEAVPAPVPLGREDLSQIEQNVKTQLQQQLERKQDQLTQAQKKNQPAAVRK